MAEHSANKYGNVVCPVENVLVGLDDDGTCSACGSSDVVMEDKNAEAMKQFIADSTGFESVTFADEDGSNAVAYDLKNTQAETEAVDKGVQENLPYQDARWHRREARRLLIGKKGMTDDEKVQRMLRAKKHLEQAIEMTIVGEADEDVPGF